METIKSRMPVVFTGHGSPMNTVENNRFTKEWTQLSEFIPKPKAILAVSAHWYTHGLFVNRSGQPEQIYDMYGFPQELYDIKYEPKGSPELARRAAGLTGAAETDEWGIDHGTWSVLRRIFPDADVPVVQLSVNGDAGADFQYQIGRKLAPLRDEGILIFGSGSIVHNLRKVDWESDDGYDWCRDFDAEIKEKIAAGKYADVVDYRHLPAYRPDVFATPEHFYPLLTVLGAAAPEDGVRVFSEGSTLGAISMTGYLLG